MSRNISAEQKWSSEGSSQPLIGCSIQAWVFCLVLIDNNLSPRGGVCPQEGLASTLEDGTGQVAEIVTLAGDYTSCR
jgi:hypothetical protein